MNKREVVWLIVRLIGVYLIYLSVVSIFSVIGAGSALASASSATPAVKPESENVRTVPTPFPMKPEAETVAAVKPDSSTEKLKSEAFKNLLFYIFLTAIYGAIGIYLIKNGRVLFDILANEASLTRKEAEPTVTTLDL
jgi:hypothetical protein